jgi:branched-chain amino acid transport system substrate-binding protein
MTSITKRHFIGAVAAVGAAIMTAPASAQQPTELKVGLVAPFSGPNARSGALMKAGAELAVEDINAKGGIASMNGVKLKLVTIDAGDSPEKAKSAAQRLLSQEPDLIAGIGAWLSSYTLAVTEVTERAGLPWLTFSYSDLLTGRGFNYIVQTSPTSGEIASASVPSIMALAERATGKRPKTFGIVADSTLSVQSFVGGIKSNVLKAQGLELVVDETFTSPLSDATSAIQKVRRARPDLLLIYPVNVGDAKAILEKMKEFGIGGGRIPVMTVNPSNASPEMLSNIGADLLQGMFVVVGNWESKQQAALAEQLRRRSGEPWVTEDMISSYGQIWLIKDALERTKNADRKTLMDAIRAANLKSGPADYFVGGDVRFDKMGRRVEAPMVLLQWQGGKPLTVAPESAAMATAVWPKQ